MKKTLFMIHGMWGGPWYWETYKGFFESRDYRCIATTLPYHEVDPQGDPDPRLGTASLLDYADALEKEIRQLGVRPILMGHSMGGLLAQILAERGLASAVVLLAPASPAGILTIRPSVIRGFLSIHLTWRFWRKPIRQTFEEAAYSMFQLMPESEQRAIYDRFVFESGRTVLEIGHWYFDSRHASRVDETKVTCPVLVVAGNEDRIAPPSVVRRVAKKYSAVATYNEFDQHGHWLVDEPGWQDIANCVAEWLDKLPAVQSS
jgi:pimeloyl-ACP methyl ester carboxylesterase